MVTHAPGGDVASLRACLCTPGTAQASSATLSTQQHDLQMLVLTSGVCLPKVPRRRPAGPFGNRARGEDSDDSDDDGYDVGMEFDSEPVGSLPRHMQGSYVPQQQTRGHRTSMDIPNRPVRPPMPMCSLQSQERRPCPFRPLSVLYCKTPFLYQSLVCSVPLSSLAAVR